MAAARFARAKRGMTAHNVNTPGLAARTAHSATSGLARQKIPERFELVTDFPRTASGKVRKDLLQANVRVKMG